MVQWRYRVEHEQRADGWHLVVRGEAVVWASGPHATQLDVEHALLALIKRWRVRAAATGGHVWRASGTELGLVLPDGATPPRGAAAWERNAITRAPVDTTVGRRR